MQTQGTLEFDDPQEAPEGDIQEVTVIIDPEAEKEKKKIPVSRTVKQIKEAEEDFEWYPTTEKIIRMVTQDIDMKFRFHVKQVHFLDIGAGDGRVMEAAIKTESVDACNGIEKSDILRERWAKDHMIAGVDFHKITLIDKDYTIIFCNPPYREYVKWTTRIIKEAHAQHVYLVIPDRWQKDLPIQNAIDMRFAKTEILGSTDFLNAERKARCKVDVIRVSYSNNEDKGAFQTFFDENFTYPKPKKILDKTDTAEEARSKVVEGQNLIDRLTNAYDARMQEIYRSIKAVCNLDYELLKELEISKGNLLKLLEGKLANTKKSYWQSLFGSLDKLKERLTKKTRNEIVNHMNKNTGLDFNTENAYAIVMWAIKHYNHYANEQFIEVYERIISKANVENYKSNQRVFDEHNFHYTKYHHRRNDYHSTERSAEKNFKLRVGHRIVLERCGGLRNDGWSSQKGLTEAAAEFLCDLMTVANNLMFKSLRKFPKAYEWESSEEQLFTCIHKEEEILLFKVRAFLNGNMHMHFDPTFIHVMNMTYGKLRGWINSKEEAEKEAGIPKAITDEYYNYSFQIRNANQLLLT